MALAPSQDVRAVAAEKGGTGPGDLGANARGDLPGTGADSRRRFVRAGSGFYAAAPAEKCLAPFSPSFS